MERHLEKCRTTTSGALGIRICGMRVWIWMRGAELLVDISEETRSVAVQRQVLWKNNQCGRFPNYSGSILF